MYSKKLANKKRDEIQQTAVNLLYRYRRILLSWATGCGKSLAAMKMIKLLTERKGGVGYLICKEHSHLDNWVIDIKKHKMDFLIDNTKMFLYDSLHKYDDKIVDFLILDECHAITEKRIAHLKKIIGPHTVVILLSATLEHDKSFLFRTNIGSYYEYHISMSHAIEMGILPYPKVFVHSFPLGQYEKEYKGLTGKVDILKVIHEENPNQLNKLKLLRAGSERKRKLAEMKTDIALNVIKDYLKGSKYIVFTGSKYQAELIDVNYVHSDLDKKEVLKRKKKFNSNKIKSLSVVNMFRESVNLEGIENGLIIQLDNVKLTFIQMLGRVFRSLVPEMHIIKFEETIDEKYLRNVLKGFNVEYIKEIQYVFSEGNYERTNDSPQEYNLL